MSVSLLLATGGLLVGAVTLTATLVPWDRLSSAGLDSAPAEEAVSGSTLYEADRIHLICSSPCDWTAIFLGQHR